MTYQFKKLQDAIKTHITDTLVETGVIEDNKAVYRNKYGQSIAEVCTVKILGELLVYSLEAGSGGK